VNLLLKGRIVAYCVAGLTLGSSLLGCTLQASFSGDNSTKTQDQASPASNTSSNSNDTNPASASSSSATDNSPAAMAKPVSVANDSLPDEYILDETCEKGTGQTGLDIYFKPPPSDSLRFACVHRVDTSPYIDYEDSAFLQNLAEVGGPYCAFSSVSDNVGCALSPITPTDLMNVPPAQEEEQEQPVQIKQPKQGKQPKQSKQKVQSEQPTPDEQSSPSKDGAGGVSNDKYYKNVDGIDVHSPAHSTDGSVPEDATAQCADGTYSFSLHRSGTCSSHGGVSQWLP
jgi:outer membrane biosynthesis protein TonB